MVLRGAEIAAPPRTSPEKLENTDLEAPPWETAWEHLEQKLQRTPGSTLGGKGQEAGTS